MSARKKRGISGARKVRRRRMSSELRRAVQNEKALAAAIDTAAVLMHQICPKRRRRKWKPVTLEQVLRSVLLVLVSHLSWFDYGKEPNSPQARIARMLAALSVRLDATVNPGGAR